MKTFNTVCDQGDVRFSKFDALPSGIHPISPENDKVILAHSETGHDHVMVLDRMDDIPSVEMFSSDNPLVSWIKVNRPTALEHHRPFDTHEPIMFGVGVYEVRRQREYTPEGFRRVED